MSTLALNFHFKILLFEVFMFLSRLLRNGKHPKTTQKWQRHSQATAGNSGIDVGEEIATILNFGLKYTKQVLTRKMQAFFALRAEAHSNP